MKPRNDNRSKRYASISTMEALRLERERLRWQVEASEEQLAGRYREVCGYFTWSHFTGSVMEYVDRIETFVASVRASTQWVSSLFKRTHGQEHHGEAQSRQRYSCGCEVREDENAERPGEQPGV